MTTTYTPGPDKAALLAEARTLEIQMRGIMRCNAYFGSHRGYLVAQARKLEIMNELHGRGAR